MGNQGRNRVSGAMRGELDCGIEAVGLRWRLIVETAHHREMQFPVTAFAKVVPPTHSGSQWIGEQRRPIDYQKGLTFHANIILMEQDRFNLADESQIVLGRVMLGNQDLLLFAIPAPRPVFICPANAERKI